MNGSNPGNPDPDDLGFTYTVNKAEELHIIRGGRTVSILRGPNASKAILKLSQLPFSRQQQLLARLSGNYRRGNEKLSRA